MITILICSIDREIPQRLGFTTNINLAGFYYKLRLNERSLDNVSLDIAS